MIKFRTLVESTKSRLKPAWRKNVTLFFVICITGFIILSKNRDTRFKPHVRSLRPSIQPCIETS